MTSTTQYDAMVIGAGQAGEPLSTALAQAGWKTALIERVHVGGTCINELHIIAQLALLTHISPFCSLERKAER